MQPNSDPRRQHPSPGRQYAPGTATDSRAQLASGVDQFMIRVNMWMAAGVGITGIAAYATAQSTALMQMLFTGGMYWVTLFAPFIFVLIFARRLEGMRPGTAVVTFLVFAAIMGISLTPVVLFYTGASIAATFAITAVTYGALAVWGFFTKRDMSGWGKFLFMALVGLIVSGIAMVVMTNVFNVSVSPIFWMARSMIGVLIFAGLTAYDTQKIKQIYLVAGGGKNLAIMGALTLYLDFVNLFMFLLQLFGGRR